MIIILVRKLQVSSMLYQVTTFLFLRLNNILLHVLATFLYIHPFMTFGLLQRLGYCEESGSEHGYASVSHQQYTGFQFLHSITHLKYVVINCF